MIRNYPGFPHGISGHELTRRACEQAWMFGAHMVFSQPTVGLARRGGGRVVHLADGRLARSMSDYLTREIEVTPNIAVRLHTEVTDGHGSGHLESLTLRDSQRNRTEQVPAAEGTTAARGNDHPRLAA